jgi:hypothetical protein
LDFGLVLPSRRIDEALLATLGDVCFGLLFAIFLTPFHGWLRHDAFSSDSLTQGTVTNFPHCGHLSVTSSFSFGISDMSKALRPQFGHFIFFAIGFSFLSKTLIRYVAKL